MIQIPSKLVLQIIKDWCLLYFKDVTHDQEAPSHWYFTIPVKPGSLFALSIVTSQVEKRAHYYQRINPKAAQSLVRLEPHSFPFLPKESLIDCNKTELLSITELDKRINPEKGLKIENYEISPSLKKKIVSAISNSPLVPISTKKSLNP